MLLSTLGLTLPAPAGTAEPLPPLPPGATLPVELDATLNPRKLKLGQTIVTELTQRVPLGGKAYLPNTAKVSGHVSSVAPDQIGIVFTTLESKGRTRSVSVRLLAAAPWHAVLGTRLPLGATDRSTSDPADWTTEQIGGDEVYRANGFGEVDNRYSEKVGEADLLGVYASPSAPGAIPHAMGPFSTDAAGLYQLPSLAVQNDGAHGTPIVVRGLVPKWKIERGTALLLEAESP